MASTGPLQDVVVVGGGATGAWAARLLCAAGLRVALIEAGPASAPRPARAADDLTAADPGQDTRAQPVQSRCRGYNRRTRDFYVNDLEHPYATSVEQPFQWIRARHLGGRLNVWGRVSLRLTDAELKAASRDGIGQDWPLSLADLAPHYDRAEQALGVTTSPLPPMPAELDFKAAVARGWPDRRVIPQRLAMRGPAPWLRAAEETGRLTVRPNAIASRVVCDARTGRATGVELVDRLDRSRSTVEGRVILLCASTLESTRLLFNSATPEHPNGLGNSSGLLGRGLMDHVMVSGYGLLPGGSHDESVEDALRGPAYWYVPSFRDGGDGFVRGYGISIGMFRGIPSQFPPAWGRLIDEARAQRRTPFWMDTFGEVLPRAENRVTLDRERVDAWGIPTVRIELAYDDNERALARDAASAMREMATAAGFTYLYDHVHLPGASVHEIGTARMGADPRTSVLDPFTRAWDVPNLFVSDGACFVSGGFQNPTLTMMALTGRACAAITEQLA